jgi:hypothetical protein
MQTWQRKPRQYAWFSLGFLRRSILCNVLTADARGKEWKNYNIYMMMWKDDVTQNENTVYVATVEWQGDKRIRWCHHDVIKIKVRSAVPCVVRYSTIPIQCHLSATTELLMCLQSVRGVWLLSVVDQNQDFFRSLSFMGNWVVRGVWFLSKILTVVLTKIEKSLQWDQLGHSPATRLCRWLNAFFGIRTHM